MKYDITKGDFNIELSDNFYINAKDNNIGIKFSEHIGINLETGDVSFII